MKHQYPLHRISYCADDKTDKRMFTFIAKAADTNEHYCYVLGSEKSVSTRSVIIRQMDMSGIIKTPAIRICKNKGADQLCSRHSANQHLWFCYIGSTILLLPKSEIAHFVSDSHDTAHMKCQQQFAVILFQADTLFQNIQDCI